MSLAPLLMSCHCHSNKNMEFVHADLTQVCLSDYTHCSLGDSDLTDTGATALARALQHNQSLEELK